MKSQSSRPIGIVLGFAIVLVAIQASPAWSSAQTRPVLTQAGEHSKPSAGDNIVKSFTSAKRASGADSRDGKRAAFDSAARTNALLQTSLEWQFGGRRQRGWSLYVPLISNMIGSSGDVASSEFAMRLSRWQKQNGLEPNGILDSEAWSQMVSRLQSRRNVARSHPAEDQLVTIPILDCYDPTRAAELRRAERETFLAYKRMIAAAAADRSLGLRVAADGQLAPTEKFLKIVSALRSPEYQEQLRRQSPASGRAGLAVNSFHSTGCALDLYVGGEPVSTKDANRALQTQGSVYRWLVKHASRFGFQPYFYEPWHWEYVGVRNTPRNENATG